MIDKIRRAFHPSRSGDVLVIQTDDWYENPSAYPLSPVHGSPSSEDTHVPIIFCGPGIEPRVIDRAVSPADIVPSLAAYLEIDPPAGSVGHALPEVKPPR